MSSGHIDFGLRIVADGEVRNAAGEIVHRPIPDAPMIDQTEVWRVDLDELREAVQRRGLTDAKLRDMGIGDSVIRQIRSTET